MLKRLDIKGIPGSIINLNYFNVIGSVVTYNSN